MKPILFAILISLSVSSPAQSTGANAGATTPLQQTLISQSQAVVQAQKSKDGDALKHLLTDDFQQVGSEGKLHDKGDFIGDAKDGKLTDFTLYNFKFLSIDDNAAIVTCDAVIHGTEGDNVLVPHYQHLSFVWVKQGDQWRLRFQQATAKRPID
jgi:uncharacterized protein (TIGR02246 family)